MTSSVSFKNVTKKYKMYTKNSDKLLDLVLPKGYGEDFFAVQNISFEAKKGDIIGIIGVNGAGKSTLSNLISGVIPPTSGSVKIEGEAALISIAAGLNNQLTGRENIVLKCLMLGFKKHEIDQLMPEIIEFADIGKFIDQPVKKYSSGMKSRLGFAISVTINPDILVIDEALSVGDKIFAQKCLDKMNSFKEMGKTIFFISHSIGQVKEFCQKALWLEAGGVRAYGTIAEVIPQYEAFLRDFNKMSVADRKKFNDYLAEKRSQAQASPEKEEQQEDIEEKQTEMDYHLSRNGQRKVKRKGRGIKVASVLLSLLLIIAAAYFYTDFKQDNNPALAGKKATVSGTDKQGTEKNKDNQVDEQAIATAMDIRYVHIPSGFVRDQPDLVNSTKITMVYFGNPIIVEQIEQDPIEDFNWLKFTLPDGNPGWISERLVTETETPVDEEALLSSMGTIVQQDQFSEYLEILGKTELELTETETSANIEMTYDSNGRVNLLNFSFDGLSKEEIISQLGEPALQESENAYLYHGEKHAFILYSDGQASFTTMSVRVVE